ncbi:hypothetical protein B0H11DRAFT_1921559 [Mycena galericulata]|nr:hypothetical protein B0H11DRAFT_1921559 [Mycena galericulata]
MARCGGDNSQCPSIPLERPNRRCYLLLEASKEPTGCSTFRLQLSKSPRTQETVSPKSDHTPRNTEGRSICIKAEKIVGDRGPKGMRDSKLVGSTSTLGGVSTTAGTTEFGTLLTPADYSDFRSSVVDPSCHADIGEPRSEVRYPERNFDRVGSGVVNVNFGRTILEDSGPGNHRNQKESGHTLSSAKSCNIPTERDLEITEAEERMAESLIHTEVTVQDTLQTGWPPEFNWASRTSYSSWTKAW